MCNRKKANIIKTRSAVTTLVHKHLKIMRIDRLKKKLDNKWWGPLKILFQGGKKKRERRGAKDSNLQDVNLHSVADAVQVLAHESFYDCIGGFPDKGR